MAARRTKTGRGPQHRRGRHEAGRADALRAVSGRTVVTADTPPRGRRERRSEPRRPEHLGRIVFVTALVLVLAALGVLAGLSWTRPVPAATFRPALDESIRLPGPSPALPWPSVGSAALAVDGLGLIGEHGSTQSVPVASITKVMTAYVVLKDHPLEAGAAGPGIAVTAADVTNYQQGLATQQSVVAVQAGETLTEQQALEGMLIPSGNNIADLLATWDAGNTAAFVAKMNADAQALGLTHTRFTDPAGLDAGSVSTASDLITLGEAAMGIPAFAQIVGQGQATLPVAGLVYNFDYALGRDGIVGIKTGTDASSGGCFLFEAQQKVDGHTVTLVGAVLGQQTVSPITAVLDAAENLAKAAFADVTSLPLVTGDHTVGTVTAPWGASVPVAATHAPHVVGWPGLTVPAHLHVGRLPTTIDAGTRLGVLQANVDGHPISIPVSATHALGGPSVFWRLTRP